MVIIDYETPPAPVGRLRRWLNDLVRAIKILLAMIGVLFASIILFFWISDIVATHQLNQRVNEAKVLGKTSAAVISVTGPPDDSVTFSNGDSDFIYEGRGVYCRVEIRHGVATKVVRWSK